MIVSGHCLKHLNGNIGICLIFQQSCFLVLFAVVFSIDAMLQTEDAHMELCRALSVSKLPESCLKLRINKLDLSCLGVARIVVLLELLDPQVSRLCLFSLFHSNCYLTFR